MPRILFPLVVLAALSGPAGAQTRKNFQVTASIVPGCSVTLDAGGSWGRVDLGTVAGTDTGSVEAAMAGAGGVGLRLDCTPGTTVGLSADAGEHAVGGARRLADASGAALPYDLFVDDGAAPWRDQRVAISFPAGVQRRSVPIRARATLPGDLPAGRYADTVRVTLSW